MIAAPGPVTAVVPAAGASRRFGGAKLLADIGGAPLLQHTLLALVGGGVARVVVVVAPMHGLGAVPLLSDPRVSVVVNPDPGRGMFSSIQAGLADAAADRPVLVLPADMPFVRAGTVARLIVEQALGGDAVVAASAGRRGHPLVLPAVIWRPLLDQSAEATLKDALASADAVLRDVPVDDPGVLRDVDERRDLD